MMHQPENMADMPDPQQPQDAQGQGQQPGPEELLQAIADAIGQWQAAQAPPAPVQSADAAIGQPGEQSGGDAFMSMMQQ